MSHSLSRPARFRPAPAAHRGHVRDTAFAVVLFFAALFFAAAVVSAPGADGVAAAEPACADACWKRVP